MQAIIVGVFKNALSGQGGMERGKHQHDRRLHGGNPVRSFYETRTEGDREKNVTKKIYAEEKSSANE